MRAASGILRDTVIAIAAFVITATAVRATLWQAGLGDRSHAEVKVRLAADRAKEVVFVGSSHIDTGLHPETFDATMMRHGFKPRSFDLTTGGLGVAETRYLLDRLFSLKPCCIDYVALEFAYMQTDVAWNFGSVRSVLYFDLRRGIDFLRLIFKYNHVPNGGPKQAAAYVPNVASAMATHYTNIGLAGALLGWGAKPLPNYSEMSFGSGSTMHPSMSDAVKPSFAAALAQVQLLRSKYIAGEALPPPLALGAFVTDSMLDHAIETIRITEARGFRVVVIQPPLLGNWTFAADFVTGFRRRCGAERLIDFGDPHEFPDLYQNFEYWHDGGHLSEKGAKVWSKMVAERFAIIAAADAAGGRTTACPEVR